MNLTRVSSLFRNKLEKNFEVLSLHYDKTESNINTLGNSNILDSSSISRISLGKGMKILERDLKRKI